MATFTKWQVIINQVATLWHKTYCEAFIKTKLLKFSDSLSCRWFLLCVKYYILLQYTQFPIGDHTDSIMNSIHTQVEINEKPLGSTDLNH